MTGNNDNMKNTGTAKNMEAIGNMEGTKVVITNKFSNARVILNCVIILLCSVIIGTILLCAVYLLPTSGMKEHLKQDMQELNAEGMYPSFSEYYSSDYYFNSWTLDNYTDALMLGTAVYDSNTSLLDKAMQAYHPYFADSISSIDHLNVYLNNGNCDSVSYARYWHGYLVFLKPMLCITDYLMLRTYNRIFQYVLMLALAVVLVRRCSWKCIPPMAAAFAFLGPGFIGYSMQYSTMFYVSMTAVLILGLCHRRLKGQWLIYYFFIVGIVTNYLDFLTYPALGLGLPLVLLAMINQSEKAVTNIFNTVCCSLAWGIGYGGMWIGKWAISSLILHNNQIADSFANVIIRSGSEVYGQTISRISAILINIEMSKEKLPLNMLLIGLIIIAVIAVWQWRKYMKTFAGYAANLFIIAMIPFVWYPVLCNHSYEHVWMVHRLLAVTIAAITASAWNLKRSSGIISRIHRKIFPNIDAV